MSYKEDRVQQLIQESGIPLRNIGNIPLVPEKIDVESFKKLALIKDNIVKFVDEGFNLLIYSDNPGNGKTTWASKLGMAYINYISAYATERPFLYLNLPLFFSEKKANIQDKSLTVEVDRKEALIREAKLVIFDDIGVRDLSEFEKQLFYTWVEYRTAEKKSCIYTSNINPANFSAIFGPRIADRIIGYSTLVEIKGQSRRNEKDFIEAMR